MTREVPKKQREASVAAILAGKLRLKIDAERGLTSRPIFVELANAKPRRQKAG